MRCSFQSKSPVSSVQSPVFRKDLELIRGMALDRVPLDLDVFFQEPTPNGPSLNKQDKW